MSGERVFLDTACIQALLNRGDQYHTRAVPFASRLQSASEVWVTEAVLIEIGDALSTRNRTGAADFIRSCYQTANINVVTLDTMLFSRALRLYETRSDKDWGLTDCISFIVMHDQGLTDAITTDNHFRQAGFRALLLDDAP